MEKENRSLKSSEVRAVPDENNRIISGYALKFNTWSDDLGGFIETISPNALDGTDLSDVRCLVDHDPSQILGRTTAGTLKLEVDDVGLRYTCTLPNTQLAKDVHENIRLGNLNQCSFGFILANDGDSWVTGEDGLYRRTLNSFSELTDVSVVTYPAYRDTDVAPALRKKNQLENELIQKQRRIRLELELLQRK